MIPLILCALLLQAPPWSYADFTGDPAPPTPQPEPPHPPDGLIRPAPVPAKPLPTAQLQDITGTWWTHADATYLREWVSGVNACAVVRPVAPYYSAAGVPFHRAAPH